MLLPIGGGSKVIRGGTPKIDWSNPITRGLTGIWLFGLSAAGTGLINLVNGRPAPVVGYTDAGPNKIVGSSIGVGVRNSVGTYYWDLGLAADLYGQSISVGTIHRLNNTSVISSFGDSVMGVLLPYSDLNVYFDLPDNVNGRVSFAHTPTTTIENWLFTSGPGSPGKTAWLNGTRKFSGSATSDTGSPSGNFFVGRYQNVALYHTADDIEHYAFATWNRKLSDVEARTFTLNPFSFLIWPEDEIFATQLTVPNQYAPAGWFYPTLVNTALYDPTLVAGAAGWFDAENVNIRLTSSATASGVGTANFVGVAFSIAVGAASGVGHVIGRFDTIAGHGRLTAVGSSVAASAGLASGYSVGKTGGIGQFTIGVSQIGGISFVGATVNGAVGSASGVGAAVAVGIKTTASASSAAGIGAVSGVGFSTVASTVAASGLGAVSAVGASNRAAQGAASGLGTVSSVGAASDASTASASGVGAVTGVGVATATATGSTSGVGVASAIGAAIGAAVGSASGVGTAAATAIAIKAATGAASGIGAIAAASDIGNVGAANGVGAVSGVGAATFAGVGAFSGVGAEAGVGAATFSGAGFAAGAGAVAGTGAAISAGVGAAAGIGSVAAVGSTFVLLYLRPDADITDGGWTNELGNNTDLYASVDETAANDSDYIQSSVNAVADVCRIRISNPSTGVGAPFKVRYRYQKQGSGTADLTVRLFQGSTQIASWTHSNISATLGTVTQTLTGPQFASITDFSNLELELQADVA
jgi:hypothetical protein